MLRKVFRKFGLESIIGYAHDWRFWLLLYVINISGNLGFTYFVSEPISVVVIFLFTFPYILKKRLLKGKFVLFAFSFWIILFLQGFYVKYYTLSTTLHYVLQIANAVSLVVVLKDKILTYYPSIICFYCVIALFCFGYNLLGGVIPYVQITETTLDDGIIMRVFNPFYTQIASPNSLTLNSFRNCGPFWEPGAFQGYINLAFFIDMISGNKDGSRRRYVIYILSVISTLSTGGYIVLFVNIMFYMIYGNKSIPRVTIVIFMALFIMMAAYLYETLPFLGEKIAENEDRRSFSLESFDTLHLLFGYGYDTRSFKSSSMVTASSIYNIVRYVGVVGLFIYMTALLFNQCKRRLFYAVILFLILMNEPFLQYSFWWAAPLFVFRNRKRAKPIGIKSTC